MSLFAHPQPTNSDHEVHLSPVSIPSATNVVYKFSCLDWKTGVAYNLEVFGNNLTSYFRHASSSQSKSHFLFHIPDFIKKSPFRLSNYNFLKNPFILEFPPPLFPEFRLFCDSHIAAVWGSARDHFPDLDKIRLPWEHEWEKLIVYLSLELDLSYPILITLSRPSSNYHIKKCLAPIDDIDNSDELDSEESE
jgi:hypothetical protein